MTIDELIKEDNERVHSPFSPSALPRRCLCAGSYRIEESLCGVQEESNEAAERGTRIHALVAYLATGGSEIPQDASADETEVAMDITTYLATEKAHHQGDYYVERRVAYRDFSGELYYGYVDCLAVCDDICTIYDWKTGFNPVQDAPSNLQGAGYALCVMQEFKKPCRVVFYAPCAHQLTEHTFTDEKGLASTITDIIARCKREDAPRTCSPEACKYCKGALFGVCPEYMASQRSCSSLMQLLPTEPAARWSDEVLAEVYRRCKLVDALEAACEGELKKRIAEKGECAGYVIKETSGGRDITDITGLYTALKDDIPQDAFLGCCKVTTTALEKLWCKAVKGKYETDRDAKAALRDTILSYSVEKPTRKALSRAK